MKHINTNMKNALLLLIFCSVNTFIYAQNRTISGTIMDADTKVPIEFCNVFQSKDQFATISDENGRFNLLISASVHKSFLIFHSIGYRPDSIPIRPDKDNYQIFLHAENLLLEDIVITGATRATLIKENPVSITAISRKQIEKATESNIIDALVKNVPGLNAVKTGPNISKPFIHGLGYNRVLTIYDGMRQEGQQYGDEHGLEVDHYNIDKAEVIKGPAGLLYGSDAIAGVISLFPVIPTGNEGTFYGKYLSEYQTNNNLIGNGVTLNFSRERLLFALRGSYRTAKNYRNPTDGRVYLTNFNESNFSAFAGFKSKKGYTHLNFTLYDNNQGIPDGSRDSLTRKFTKQIFEGENDDLKTRPIVSDKELNTYKVPDLAQHIQHYRIYVQGFYQIGKGEVDYLLGGQQNTRREYTHPSMPQQAGMYMRLNTLNYGIRYNAPKFANIETSLGVNGMLQNNKNKDATDFPIPDYHLYDGGMYLYARIKKGKWSVSGGVRYDLRLVQWNDFYVGINPETGFEHQTHANDSKANLQFPEYQNSFHGISGSIGTTYKISPNINLKANIGRAYRSPNITEIGSNGLDPGAHIIYLGNRNFKPEFSLQEDFSISLRYKNISAEAGFFNNNIQNYIYMATVADAQGFPITDAQGNRTYQYQQSSAHLFGSELWFAVHPERLVGFRWDNSLSIVYGLNKNPEFKGKGNEGEFLPLMPPLKVTSRIEYEVKPHTGRLLSITPGFEMEYNHAQNRYLALNGSESFTPEYTLFNLGLNAEVKYNNSKAIQIILQLNNMLDKAYRSHLNRLKYFEYYSSSPNGHDGIYDMGRNLSLKIIVPL